MSRNFRLPEELLNVSVSSLPTSFRRTLVPISGRSPWGIKLIRKLRPYFQGHDIKVYTNQPLRKILHKPDLSGRLVNWVVELSQFNITYLPRPSIKGQALSDFLIECSTPSEDKVLPENSSQLTSLPLSWLLFVDGTSTSDSSGVGILLISPEGFEIQQSIRFGFPATNNCSEYEALLASLRLAKAHQVQHFKAYSDSQLIVNHVLGGFTAKSPLMIEYLEETRAKLPEFRIAFLEGIVREKNQRADVLAKLAKNEDHSPSTCLYKILLTSPSVTPLIEPASEILILSYSPNWMTPIYLYLQEGILPQNKREAQLLRSKAAHYTVINDTLYRRSFLAPLLKCVDCAEADYFMLEVQEGICGSHSSGEALAYKIIKEELPNILWAYHTDTRKPTEEGPFWHTYGTKALVLVEIGEPSFRVQNYNSQLNQQGLLINLDFLEERRENALIRMTNYKQNTALYFGKVLPRQFQVDDQVLRVASVSAP
ncbi:uncharacterized protein LOC141697776 [Apium graveolens]|uniref:uncharacterized protein LOC141697776 n=1 Tax=Apium graveolens TaxID=4045 RepID=UPI003D7B570F